MTSFESGVIVLHIAAKSDMLAQHEVAGKAQITTWVIAVLNSVEPHTQNLIQLDDNHAEEAWTKACRQAFTAMLERRLASLAT